MNYLECISCGSRDDIQTNSYQCSKCGDLLEVRYDLESLKEIVDPKKWTGSLRVWRYKDLMPLKEGAKIVTLNEGGTNLAPCDNLKSILNISSLQVKNEGENPTGSFKDRGMTVAVSRAVEQNAKVVICASTGNTASSAAAYAARAGLRCVVIVPSRAIALGKLAQATIHGAEVVQVKGNFDQSLKMVLDFANRHKEIYLLNSLNPFRLEGQRSLAFEICEQTNYEVPDRIVVPVGNAGNISAIWKGFSEFHKLGIINKLPKMTGIQAEGASPIADAVKRGDDKILSVERPETVATAIRIGAPASWKKALKAIRMSGGTAEKVNDQEILEAQRLLARNEGIFTEPAGASSIAGLKKLLELGVVDSDENVVCICTGHGLKDPDIVMQFVKVQSEMEPEMESMERALGIATVVTK
ncbi:MAG: threonine synthase [Thaumarchaeota archaeon]|nr:threonine synthase [Nitrososphaerota archaeon]